MMKHSLANAKILILTECSNKIGIGHLVRCIALYQAFEEKGANIKLIINGDKSVLYLLKDTKYQILNWLIEQSRLFKRLKNINMVVIDSYLAPKSFYNKLSRAVCEKIIIIDDLNRLKYPKSIVINPSIYGDKLIYPENKEIVYLLGKNYIILRKPFWEGTEKHQRKMAKDILITFGGSEQNDFIMKLLSYLSIEFSGFTYHLVAPNFKLKNNYNLKLKMYSNLSALEMRRLMLKCDFCISAGGQTLYELIRTNIPVIAICFAYNQLIGLDYFGEHNAIINVGWFNDNSLWDKLEVNFKKLLVYKERKKIVNRITEIIDGKGTGRIIDEILSRTK